MRETRIIHMIYQADEKSIMMHLHIGWRLGSEKWYSAFDPGWRNCLFIKGMVSFIVCSACQGSEMRGVILAFFDRVNWLD